MDILRTFNNEMNEDRSGSFHSHSKTSSYRITTSTFPRVSRDNVRRTSGSLCVNMYYIRFRLRIRVHVLRASTQTGGGRVRTTRLISRRVRFLTYVFLNCIRHLGLGLVQYYPLRIFRDKLPSTNCSSLPSVRWRAFYGFLPSTKNDTGSGNFFRC